MTFASSSGPLFVLAAVAFLAIGALVSALATHLLRGTLMALPPRARHRAFVGLAGLPIILALTLGVSAILPALVALVVPEADHCPLHDDVHAHLCFVHAPSVQAKGPVLLALGAVAGYALLRGGFAVDRAVRAAKLVDCLMKTGRARDELGVTVIDTREPVCLAAGLFRPKILLSSGLLKSLSRGDLQIVLAHERAHVRRRDALIETLARAATMFHWPSIGRWLMAELRVAAEQSCDDEAALAIGDRLAVAKAILTMERFAQEANPALFAPSTVAFGACAISRRVEALLAPPNVASAPAPLRVSLGAWVVGAVTFSDPIHHLTESLLSFVAH